MASLARDAAAFKNTLSGADTRTWHSSNASSSKAAPGPSATPLPAATPTAAIPPTDVDQGKKKKRPKTNIVYSQPADTGTGVNVNTQLVYAVTHLKSVNGPARLQDIAIVTSTPLETDQVLLEKFKAHDRVEFDPKTNLYSYRHDYNVRNKAALLTEIQRATRRGGGLSVRALKESWREAPTAIEELEKEGEIFVTRTLKDGQMRMVFWNEVKATPDEFAAVEGGNGSGLSVEKEFNELWHRLKVPNDVDLLRQLESEGLQATAADAPAVKAPTGKRKGKKSGPRQRQSRITNTHLKGHIDLSKDYVAPGK
ncbi:transcription initiation factor IIE subunit beta [Amylostereum chailletii]|nr:transcription initiation factor IIE subunit beta [Amylostereum chailletii]